MIFIRWWTAGWTLAGLSIAVCLGVVCIQYALYMDADPRLQQDWPKLVTATVMFAALGAIGALSFWTLHRASRWRWPMQGMLLMTTLVFGRIFWQLLSA